MLVYFALGNAKFWRRVHCPTPTPDARYFAFWWNIGHDRNVGVRSDHVDFCLVPMLSCEIIPYMMLLPNRIYKKTTWCPACSSILASNRDRPAISWTTGENGASIVIATLMPLRCVISSRNKPLHSYHGLYKS